MYKVGIVGHGQNKFNERTKKIAKNTIRNILTKACATHAHVCVVSGHSPVGGIDIWAEEIAAEMNLATDIKAPRQQTWDAEYGFKQRNLDIARTSDEVHTILVEKLPDGYKGRRFESCYHCDKHGHHAPHVKSGGCWTMWQAQDIGKDVQQHIIKDRAESAVTEVI